MPPAEYCFAGVFFQGGKQLDISKTDYTFDEFREIIALLRSENGCPWDRAQTHKSLEESLTDECAEVIDAIEHGTSDDLCEELGDVLLQVMLHSRIAEEAGLFTIDDVVSMICRKMIRRHPHVFAGEVYSSPEEGKARWNEIKQMEKEAKLRGEKL